LSRETEVRDATKKLAEAAADVPDAQAASLAEMFGTTTERVQRTLVTISSGMAQAIKFACMFFGVLMWPNKPSSASAEMSSEGSSASSAGGNSSGNSKFSGEMRDAEQENVLKFPTIPRAAPEQVEVRSPNNESSACSETCSPGSSTSLAASSAKSAPEQVSLEISKFSGVPNNDVRDVRPHIVQPNISRRCEQSEALADLVRLLCDKGSIASQRHLCERWSRPRSVVSEWLSGWEADGYIVRRRDGNQKSISLGSAETQKWAKLAIVHAPGRA
jgi:hypothetical protein